MSKHTQRNLVKAVDLTLTDCDDADLLAALTDCDDADLLAALEADFDDAK